MALCNSILMYIDNAEYAIDNNANTISKMQLCSNNDKAIISSFDRSISISIITIPSMDMNEKLTAKKDYNAIKAY